MTPASPNFPQHPIQQSIEESFVLPPQVQEFTLERADTDKMNPQDRLQEPAQLPTPPQSSGEFKARINTPTENDEDGIPPSDLAYDANYRVPANTPLLPTLNPIEQSDASKITKSPSPLNLIDTPTSHIAEPSSEPPSGLTSVTDNSQNPSPPLQVPDDILRKCNAAELLLKLSSIIKPPLTQVDLDAAVIITRISQRGWDEYYDVKGRSALLESELGFTKRGALKRTASIKKPAPEDTRTPSVPTTNPIKRKRTRSHHEEDQESRLAVKERHPTSPATDLNKKRKRVAREEVDDSYIPKKSKPSTETASPATNARTARDPRTIKDKAKITAADRFCAYIKMMFNERDIKPEAFKDGEEFCPANGPGTASHEKEQALASELKLGWERYRMCKYRYFLAVALITEQNLRIQERKKKSPGGTKTNFLSLNITRAQQISNIDVNIMAKIFNKFKEFGWAPEMIVGDKQDKHVNQHYVDNYPASLRRAIMNELIAWEDKSFQNKSIEDESLLVAERSELSV